jgi:hypothetical protein
VLAGVDQAAGRTVPSGQLHQQINSCEESQDGSQWPADKLVITPRAPVPDGQVFTVTVNYTGAPGVHYDGDGSAEGWFRTADGNWMATEPVGTEDWTPLNDSPTAKPTYDFSITTERGKTAIANGQRASVINHPPDAEFPQGSATTVWHAPMPIASYQALTIIGNYTSEVHTIHGTRYYAFQSQRIPAHVRARNAALIAAQAEVTRFEAQYTGPFLFASDGIVVGSPATRSSEEEMESMIVFPWRWTRPGLPGWALSRELPPMAGRQRQRRQLGHDLLQGGHGDVGGAALRRASSCAEGRRAKHRGRLRRVRALRRYAGSSITEPQLEAAFAARLSNHSAACHARLSQFFTQWFDTAYHGSKPQITGPRLHGHPFYADGCTRAEKRVIR